MRLFHQLLLGILVISLPLHSSADLVINEIASKGTGEICGGEDWVELLNSGDDSLDLANYTLHDDKGAADEDAVTLDGKILAPGDLLLLCRDAEFPFGIGSDDTITLLDASGNLLDSVTLPEGGSSDGTESYALVDGEFRYTATPTPGETNIYTKPLSREEKLTAQEEAGTEFFDMESDAFGKVVDIDIAVGAESLDVIENHPAWETWVSFDGMSITTTGDEDSSPLAVSSAGRIRVKGQSTNTIPACLGLRNLPFNIRFDTPFLGMENFYLRNHLGDFSYMRDHAAHVMLKAYGLPYVRSRPARVFINGVYTGFYTLMEAPTQAYVLQRSLGVFDPEKTAIFKAKTSMDLCPPSEAIAVAQATEDGDSPDQYYFERGDHRLDTPVLGDEDACGAFFFGEVNKEQNDVARGYLDYDEDCGRAMVELGRVDRDYGPRSIEEPMIEFLNSKFYNASHTDLSDSVDTDQWLKNFAAYAIMLNVDSPINFVNNWYIATTDGGADDWKIVQYDHNNIASTFTGLLCSDACSKRLVYWPILRPTCTSVEDQIIVGRLLNSDENVQKYINYVQEFLDAMTTEGVLENLYAYGDAIKDYVVDDPLMPLDQESYESIQLGRDLSDYNSETLSPFLKIMTVRFEEVQKQLDAIANGTLPGGGVYEKGAKCPDWRDSNSENYFAGSSVAEDCAVPFCEDVGICYENSEALCNLQGEFVIPDCEFASPICDSCFPYSRCGTGGPEDYTGILVESETCGPELAAECAEAPRCFSHASGVCAFDGEILTVECQPSLPCKPCFPYSRCGSGEPPEVPPTKPPTDDAGGDAGDTGTFVESEVCGAGFELCAQAGPCFDHNVGCAEDGSMLIEECSMAVPFCEPCFPYSRCGSAGGEEVVESESDSEDSAMFVESEECGPEFASCAQAGPCYDHALGCAEDGSMLFEDCNAAVEFCSACFPFSRCGGDGGAPVADEGEEEEDVGMVTEDSPEDEVSKLESSSDGHRLGGGTTVWWSLVLMILALW